jgi:hypothetical protein
VPYLPEWEGPIEGYSVNFLKANLWKVAATHDYDDAMQEAKYCFVLCAAKYPLLDTPQHFMALFKTTLRNHFIDLAYSSSSARQLVPEETDAGGETRSAYDIMGDTDNNGALLTALRQAPREVLMVVNLFLNAPQELLEMAAAAWRKNGRYNADGDKAVARMLGLPADSAPVTRTRQYFENSH